MPAVVVLQAILCPASLDHLDRQETPAMVSMPTVLLL